MTPEANDASRLPGGFARTTGSTCERLLRIPAEALRTASADLRALEASLDIEHAHSHSLDLYGESFHLPRSNLDDTQYRFLLKCRIERNFSKSTHTGIIRSIENIFSLQPNEVALADSETSGMVHVTRLPFSALQRAGFTGEQTEEILKELFSTGVGLEMNNFEGTFCFAETDDVYNEEQGFSDSELPENQTMGGYFGYLVGIDNSLPLPL